MDPNGPDKDPLLAGLGQRVRLLRARGGISRRMLAEEAGVSERHLANLESGIGNVSVLVLQQVALALGSSLAELLGDETTITPEWLMIRKLLHGRTQDELQRAHQTLAELFGAATPGQRRNHIALVGLRGAGGLVGDPATFDIVLSHCLTIWLQADPQDHLDRVIAQGEQRQMADSRKAVDDLRVTLESRAAFYAKADFAFNTSGKTVDESFTGLMAALAEHQPKPGI